MKHKRNTRKRLIVVLVILGVILAVLVGALIYMELGEREGQSPAETIDPGNSGKDDGMLSGSADDMVIPTDFCCLNFPGQWEEQIRTEIAESDDGEAVIFYGTVGGKETELFTVLFGRSAYPTGSPVGALDVDGEAVLVSVKMSQAGLDESWTAEERNTVAAMREAVSYLIERLSAQPGFSADASGVLYDDLQVATPYATLHYPGQWQERVWAEYTQTETGGYATFYGAVGGEDVTLFTVNFGPGGDGISRAGFIRVNGIYVEVGIRMDQPDNTENWSEADQDMLAAMREGVNDLIRDLKQNSGLVSKPETTPAAQPDTEAVVVSTPYADLVVPAQWKEQMRAVKEEMTGGCAVTFFGTAGDHEEALFTILFGVETEKSTPAGTLNADGVSVSVSVELMRIATDDTWSAEEEETIMAMQDSVNDILQKLEENFDFTVR